MERERQVAHGQKGGEDGIVGREVVALGVAFRNSDSLQSSPPGDSQSMIMSGATCK